MIMGDDHFGFHNPWTGETLGEPEWTTWDFTLAQVDQLIDDYSDANGLLLWEVDDPHQRVRVDAEKRVDKFEAAKQRKTSGKRYKPTPGEYFVPVVVKTSEEWPTLEEYVTFLAEKEKARRGE